MNKIAMMSDHSNVIHSSFKRTAIRRIVDRIRAWNERRAAIRQLHAMSDRMLRDIGIQRHEIHAAVNRTSVSAKIVPARINKPEAPGELRKAA